MSRCGFTRSPDDFDRIWILERLLEIAEPKIDDESRRRLVRPRQDVVADEVRTNHVPPCGTMRGQQALGLSACEDEPSCPREREDDRDLRSLRPDRTGGATFAERAFGKGRGLPDIGLTDDISDIAVKQSG